MDIKTYNPLINLKTDKTQNIRTEASVTIVT